MDQVPRRGIHSIRMGIIQYRRIPLMSTSEEYMRIIDKIYIKTQVFRLLRYYSSAPRNIARSDWVTQNITHNMTSSIVQPYGPHSLSNYASFRRKGNFNYALHKRHEQKELQEITHHSILYSNYFFIYFI